MVYKITWQKAGGVTEPGRYMFTFGWLTVTAEDLAIWKQYPDAEFTLVEMPLTTRDPTQDPEAFRSDEYHLGAFELHPSSSRPPSEEAAP